MVNSSPILAPSLTYVVESSLVAPIAGVTDKCLGEDLLLQGDGGKHTFTGHYSDDRYDKNCSFVVSSNSGVNCSSIYKDYIKDFECIYIAKLNVDKTWLESIKFDKVEFCWGRFKGSVDEIITTNFDWWYLKDTVKCSYNIMASTSKWITVYEPHKQNKYLVVPNHNNQISVKSKRMGTMMAVLNVSPWYMVQLLKLPHDPTSKTVWTVPFKKGRYPFAITSTIKNKWIQYMKNVTTTYNCTRVYSEFYTFCIEAYNNSHITDLDMMPKKYKIEDSPYDLFDIHHYSGFEYSTYITSFFDNILNHTAEEISGVFKQFSNLTFDPKDLFLDHVLKPTEHYVLSLGSRFLKSILATLSDWIEFVEEEYLAMFVSVDCDYMLFEITIIVLIFFYYFPAYILTGVFATALIMFIGIKRKYISFSPIELTVTTINHFADKRLFHLCNETDCYFLYDLKCTSNR